MKRTEGLDVIRSKFYRSGLGKVSREKSLDSIVIFNEIVDHFLNRDKNKKSSEKDEGVIESAGRGKVRSAIMLEIKACRKFINNQKVKRIDRGNTSTWNYIQGDGEVPLIFRTLIV